MATMQVGLAGILDLDIDVPAHEQLATFTLVWKQKHPEDFGRLQGWFFLFLQEPGNQPVTTLSWISRVMPVAGSTSSPEAGSGYRAFL